MIKHNWVIMPRPESWGHYCTLERTLGTEEAIVSQYNMQTEDNMYLQSQVLMCVSVCV